MLTFNDLCSQLASKQLVDLEVGHTYRLEEFVQLQEAHQEASKETLAEFAESALECVTQACTASLDELESQLTEVCSVLALADIY